jgi:hypothetical protein
MIAAPDGIRAEQSAEQQHFGREKQPDAELSRFELLRQAVPVMGQMLRVLVTVRIIMAGYRRHGQ